MRTGPRRPYGAPTLPLKLGTPVAMLVLAGAVVGSATTGAVAGSLVTGAQIKNGSVTGKDVKDGSLKTGDLAQGGGSARTLRHPDALGRHQARRGRRQHTGECDGLVPGRRADHQRRGRHALTLSGSGCARA